MNLTDYEKRVLYGITSFPNCNDRELAEKLGIKQPTFSAIRRRLKKEGYYKILYVPMIQSLGAEILAVIYTNFNPVIPLEKRVEITGQKIEKSEEILFSMGEEDKGFSISFAKNYTTIGDINDVRTETFGKLRLIEKEYPKEVIFPFSISKVYRFFNFAPLMARLFGYDEEDVAENFFSSKDLTMSKKEKMIFCKLIEFPETSSKDIAEMLDVTRHTVGKLRKKFIEKGYIKVIAIPNFRKLDLKILTFYHVQLNPHNPPDFEKDEIKQLLDNSIVFLASRKFEFVAMSLHSDYEDHAICKTKIMQKLKERDWITLNPVIRTYSLNKSRIIKDFTFSQITKKILGC